MSRRQTIRHISDRGLSYERRGDGRPIVLLHGWCLNGRLWTYLAEALEPDFDVIVPDQAGFGRSSDLGGPYDLAGYADDVLGLLDELECQNAVLVGFAFGAAVAMAAAASNSSRIGAIVSIGVPSAAHSPYDRMPKAMRRDWPEFARRSGRAICKGEHSEATYGWLERMFGATPLPVAIETVGLLGRFEPASIAGDVAVPALFLHGELDDVVPLEISATCADLAPQGQVRVIEDSGHLVLIDQPQRLQEHLIVFLRPALAEL